MDVQDFKHRFFDSSIADILRAIAGGSKVGAFILTFSSIAALSEVYCAGDFTQAASKPPSWKDKFIEKLPRIIRDFIEHVEASEKSASNLYRKWVEEWFKAAGVKEPHEWYTYAVRCALAHTYGGSTELERMKTQGYSLRHAEPMLHWKKRTKTPQPGYKQGYMINLDSFVAEYIVAAFYFFDAMDNLTGTERTILLKRLENQIDIYDPDDSGNSKTRIAAPRTYAAMHSALADCDSGKPEVERVRTDICRLYL